jgi:hypothetical protein
MPKFVQRYDERATQGDTSSCVCPYCGYLMTDLWEYRRLGKEEPVEIQCGSCEEPILLRPFFTFSVHACPTVEHKDPTPPTALGREGQD